VAAVTHCYPEVTVALEQCALRGWVARPARRVQACPLGLAERTSWSARETPRDHPSPEHRPPPTP
jgi:hypothetical protein